MVVRKSYDIGIDVGAIDTKAILLKDGKEILRSSKGPTTMEPEKVAKELMEGLLRDAGVSREEVSHIVATGQGRRTITFADMARTEITAFAKGAHYLKNGTELVIDIGGHGVRVMRLGEGGIVADFRTNDKCSSGTGCFMDAMAVALSVSVEEAGNRSLKATSVECISSNCTVFAESEVVSMIARGKTTEEILAGINRMVARRIVALVNATGSRGMVLVCGGVAQNKGLIKELNDIIDREMFVPEGPTYVGALGAALLAPRDEITDMVSGPAEKGKGPSLIRKVLGWA